MSDVRWYALWTRSRHEQVVREQLAQKQIEAFLPTVTKWSRWKDRKKKIDWPLFPGYCFAKFDPAEALAILKCTGVVNIVSVEGKPALAGVLEPGLAGLADRWAAALVFVVGRHVPDPSVQPHAVVALPD